MRLKIALLVALAAAIVVVAPGTAATLFGDQTIEPSVDYSNPGEAEAFQTSSSITGVVSTISIYLDARSAASSVAVGLYADASGHPGTLLGSGTITTPANGAWNTVSVGAANVTAGSNYWIALLAPSGGGLVYYRDKCCGSGSAAETSSQKTLASLPTSWSAGTRYNDGPLSAYASSAVGPVLSVSPTSLAFTGTQGGSDPAAKPLSISNGGGGTLTWTAASNATWLAATPTSGSGAATVQVSTSLAGLAPGTYNGTVTVSASGATGSPTQVGVTLTVSAPGPPPDTTLPTVSVTAPGAGTTVTGVVNVTANASDNVGVVGVQFKLDGSNLGLEDGTSPYGISWDTSTASAGNHILTAVARDAATNTATSSQVAVTVQSAVVPPTAGLAAAYSFDEGSGTTLSDTSGNGNTGTIANGTWTSGRFGWALSFNGATSMVTVPDSASLDLTTVMTIEAWVNESTLGTQWRTVAIKEQSNNLVYSLYGNTASTTPSTDAYIGGADRELRGPSAVPLNTWTHLAETYDGATQRLYVNGTQVATRAQTGLITTSTGSLRIGGNSIWGEWFSGKIDELRIYNRALSATELQTDMNTAVSAGGPPPAPSPDVVGSWSGPVNFPLVPVHLVLQPTGKVLMWDAFEQAPQSQRLWDPATGAFTSVPSPNNFFCSAQVLLPDGRTLLLGGHITVNNGHAQTNIFDPSTNTWSRGADMNHGRWYGTATVLGDGRVLVFSGDNLTQTTTPPHGPYNITSDSTPEVYDPATNTFKLLTAGRTTSPYYPQMFVLPDGKVFDAGPDTQTREIDPNTGIWTNVGASPITAHSAVMYRPGKVLKTGTWSDPDYADIPITARAAVIDMTAPTPAWREVAPMKYGRAYHNLVALPDGTVLAVGGGTDSSGADLSKASLSPEIWNPTTETWTTMAPEQIGRLYHSTALLLPDGRVLVAGGGGRVGFPYVDETNAEIFSPPYLAKGTRPTISSAPASPQYASTFFVGTPDATRIASVALVRTGSDTHAFDENQRYVPLSFTQGTGGLNVTAPANGNIAPPGYYMLFIVDTNGVPSVASFVKVPVLGLDTQAPSAPGAVTATGAIGRISLSWGAATDDRGVTRYHVYRSAAPGVTPTQANQIATPTSTSYTDTNLPAGTYYYVVTAEDAAGNIGSPSAEASVASLADTTAPSVAISSPVGGTVSGVTSVSATASDNVGVSGVQFKLDGANLGAEVATSPYSTSWDTRTATNGTHTLTAVARDAAGNSTPSAPVTVTVSNTAGTPGGLVAAYSFDENTGTTVRDTSGNGNNGTGANITWTTGKYGSAISFNGTSSMVTVPNSASLGLTTGITAEAWINPATLGAVWRTVVLKEQPSNLVYSLYASNDGQKPSADLWIAAGDRELRGPATLTRSVWTHLAMTYDGATQRLFVNGAQVASRAQTGAVSTSSGVLRIGGNTIWGEWFSGVIDEVRLYNRALTATEIQADMNAPVGGSVPAPLAAQRLTAHAWAQLASARFHCFRQLTGERRAETRARPQGQASHSQQRSALHAFWAERSRRLG